MARRRSSRRLPTANNFSIASPRLVRVRSALDSYRAAVTLLDDRRRFHPLGIFRPAVAIRRPAARIVIKSPEIRPFKKPDVFGFAVPRRVAVCVRRSQRREVLFAKKRVRSGAGSPKRRNYYSAISCKRS